MSEMDDYMADWLNRMANPNTEDVIELLKKTDIEDISDVSHTISYKLSNREMTELVTYYKEASEMQNKIESLLDDINYHRECALLQGGKADELLKECENRQKNKDKEER